MPIIRILLAMEEALSGLARFLLAAAPAAFFCDCCGCGCDGGGGGCSLWRATTGWYRLVFAQEKGSTVLVILRDKVAKILIQLSQLTTYRPWH